MIHTKQIKDKKDNLIGEISYSLEIDFLHIDSIWVHHKSRRQGIGKAMILWILGHNETEYVTIDVTDGSKKIFENMSFKFNGYSGKIKRIDLLIK